MRYAILLRIAGQVYWLHPAMTLGTTPKWSPETDNRWLFLSKNRAEGEARFWGGSLAEVVEV